MQLLLLHNQGVKKVLPQLMFLSEDSSPDVSASKAACFQSGSTQTLPQRCMGSSDIWGCLFDLAE